MKPTRIIVVVAVLAALTACNPVEFDPPNSYPGFEIARVTVTGPEPMWLESAVVHVDGYAIYALAALHHEGQVGPAERLCIQGGAEVPCSVSSQDIRQPGQSILTPAGRWERMMQVWPGEAPEIWLVCIDESTQDLDCPDSLRMQVRTVDQSGALVGDITSVS